MESDKRRCDVYTTTVDSNVGVYQVIIITTCSIYAADMDYLNDAQRIEKVKLLIEAGFMDRVLLSHCMHTKHRLVSSCANCIIVQICNV